MRERESPTNVPFWSILLLHPLQYRLNLICDPALVQQDLISRIIMGPMIIEYLIYSVQPSIDRPSHIFVGYLFHCEIEAFDCTSRPTESNYRRVLQFYVSPLGGMQNNNVFKRHHNFNVIQVHMLTRAFRARTLAKSMLSTPIMPQHIYLMQLYPGSLTDHKSLAYARCI